MSKKPIANGTSDHKATDSDKCSPQTKRPRLSSQQDFETTATTQEQPKPQSSMEVDQEPFNGVASQNGDAANDDDQHAYNQQLYSRQIYALGEQAMRRLRGASVLVAGMGGLGVEIAKNLILGGIRTVTIQDTLPVTNADFSSQYYCVNSPPGINRASACRDALCDLSDNVSVDAITEPLSPELVKNFDLTVLTDHTISQQKEVSKWIRACGPKHGLMVAQTRGLFGKIFIDLGPNFVVEDVNGEQPSEVLLEHVDRETGDVLTLEDARHNLEDGDFVTFSGIKGMTELNNINPPFKVKVINKKKFNIGDIKSFSAFEEGGKAIQVKQPKLLEFKELSVAMDDADDSRFVLSDFAKMERPKLLHLGWLALDGFIEAEGRLPKPHDEEDAQKVLAMFRHINASHPCAVQGSDDSIIKELSFQAAGTICPMTGFLGGVAAQEAMKAVTHIFHPIHQWFYFDALECLPDPSSAYRRNADTCKPNGTRYDGQTAVFGSDVQDAISKQKWFIVGAGAIGCELLKNFVMMGLGHLKVTDMDTIELSNLNRQFLFRKDDVGKRKAEVAAAAARSFNKMTKIEWLVDRVGPDTEQVFSDVFFEQLNGVANALDNVEARSYMDRRCVYYALPLLESGTLGPKGNVQVIYPHLTESYSSSQDPPETSIPFCTLSNFPSTINHTIIWARERLFESIFTGPAQLANQFLSDPRAFLERIERHHVGQKLHMMQGVKKTLIDDRPKDSEDCVAWARLLFEEYFHNNIAQLLFNFPADQITTTGAKFWSGTKLCPHVLDFEPSNNEHVDFVLSASILRAEMYGLPPIKDRAAVVKMASAIEVARFVPKSGVKIAVTESDATAQQDDENSAQHDENQLENLHIALAKLGNRTQQLNVIYFEKDDDTNFHMDFIVSASNLRAENYGIPKADKMKTKQIAGRIIPALATTTAAVSGLVALELYKIIIGKCKLEQFKNGFLNLALPFFGFSEPIAAPVKKFYDNSWTLWDCIEVNGCAKPGAPEMTLGDLNTYLLEKHRLKVSMMSQGVSMIFSFFMSAEKREERLKMPISRLVETVSQKPIPPHVKALVLEFMCNDENDEDLEVPYVKYLLPKREQ